MIKDRINNLLEPYDSEIRQLIDVVLTHEQRFITHALQTNSSRLKEVKQKIREEIDTLSKTGYEA